MRIDEAEDEYEQTKLSEEEHAYDSDAAAEAQRNIIR